MVGRKHGTEVSLGQSVLDKMTPWTMDQCLTLTLLSNYLPISLSTHHLPIFISKHKTEHARLLPDTAEAGS